MNLKQFCVLGLMAVLIVLTSAVMILVRDQLYAQTTYPGAPRPSDELLVFSPKSGMLANFSTREDLGIQSVTIVDPETKSIGFYQIQLSDGTIKIKNVRNIGPDLKLEHYNGAYPLPSDIERILETKNSPRR